ncbi:hypothetical protein GGI04_000453 [Coemansia thaxteri]|nr:hypothetical protein GGI04_000453 [Coemansia thaxteri]KAJ2473963.1 hypothetical protein GGI02_000481 [Coemansia sp. RSA 2322]KAJ2480973.1 hypothetical protein EV174_003589 [Coemansia sp. RSA 2320]
MAESISYSPNTSSQKMLVFGINSQETESINSFDAIVGPDWRLEMLSSLNSIRAKAGVPPMTLNANVNGVAQSHSNYQASTKQMTHNDASGSLGQRVTDAGISWRMVAENVASGSQTVPDVISLWANSPGHYANMIGNYTLAGFGLATDGSMPNKGTTYWTQCFVYP